VGGSRAGRARDCYRELITSGPAPIHQCQRS